ncbi:hypothetical protein MKW94_002224, partial [Papaver nudicaule]|nr:hypothetical protein [Papaver nudicaule]
STIRDKIIPHAVLWFTGEASQVMHYEDDDTGTCSEDSDDNDMGGAQVKFSEDSDDNDTGSQDSDDNDTGSDLLSLSQFCFRLSF